MKLLEKARVRVVWLVVGIGATTLGVIAWTTIPAWPVVGVAVATLVVAINSLTTRLDKDRCLACGHTLRHAMWSEHGGLCTKCNQINPPTHAHLAKIDAARTRELFEANRATPADLDPNV